MQRGSSATSTNRQHAKNVKGELTVLLGCCSGSPKARAPGLGASKTLPRPCCRLLDRHVLVQCNLGERSWCKATLNNEHGGMQGLYTVHVQGFSVFVAIVQITHTSIEGHGELPTTTLEWGNQHYGACCDHTTAAWLLGCSSHWQWLPPLTEIAAVASPRVPQPKQQPARQAGLATSFLP
jgi:hypothetical protein